MNANYRIIDTAAGLINAVQILEKQKVIAVDLEADSMFHFKEKVCLLQIASETDNTIFIIDTVAVNDLSPLRSVFADSGIRKVFHGADYDVRSLYRDFKIVIRNLFDTELAGRFLGSKETGLNSMLQHYFNVQLDKKYQKKDWSLRPLPEGMLEYAAGDVHHLIPLSRNLIKELKAKKRLAWVLEECDNLSSVRPPADNNFPLFLKFKGAGRLNSRALAVLEALLRFRQEMAREKDRPLFKIIGNASLQKLALARPVSLKQLERVHELSGKQIQMYGKSLIETVKNALQTPEDMLPVYPREKAPQLTGSSSDRMKKLKIWRDGKAETLNMDPSLLINKGVLVDIAQKYPLDEKKISKIKEMKNWQKKEFGKELVNLINHKN